MKKYLKIIIPITLAVVGLVLLYQFVYIPREEAKKLEAAKREAFFECDKRWEKVSSQYLSQQIIDLSDKDCQQRWQKQQKSNETCNSRQYPEDIKSICLDYIPYEFFLDSNTYCSDGRVSLHDRNSYTVYCKNWYLLNIGLDPWNGYGSNAEYHYH